MRHKIMPLQCYAFYRYATVVIVTRFHVRKINVMPVKVDRFKLYYVTSHSI